MNYRRKKLGTYIAILVIGLILGGVFGELFTVLPIPEGAVKDFFTTNYVYHLGSIAGPGDPGVLDLRVLKLSAGIGIKVNVMSIIGLLIAAYLFRVFL